MTTPQLNPYSGLGGGLYGGHWPTNSQAHGDPALGANLSLLGALAAQQAAFAGTAAPRRTRKHAGIRAGEIIAWRCWSLGRKNTLQSMVRHCAWWPGVPMTGDIDSAGVHSWKEKMEAISYGLEWDWREVVVGSIKLWGEVDEYERGWTAEKAKIVSLDIILHGSRWEWRNNRKLRKLRAKYLLTD